MVEPVSKDADFAGAGIGLSGRRSANKCWLVHHVAVEGQHGAHAGDVEFAQRLARAGEGYLARGAPHDELGNERVIVRRDNGSRADSRIDADAGASGRLEGDDGAGAGGKTVEDVFGIDAELKGVAGGIRILRDRQGLACGDAELLGDDIGAGHHLGYGVLDLDAGIDLQKGDGAVLGNDVFHGAGAGIAHVGTNGARAFDDAGALGIGKRGRRGLLDELLEAALGGAIAGA